jgi:hypothetical protein
MLMSDPPTTTNGLERLLLSEALGGAEPRLLLHTRTPVDTGRWWRRSPLWLCVTPEEVILFAVGRRRYLERIPVDDCRASSYNHATGELVLAPAETPRFRCLRMKPSEALRVLALISPTVHSPTPYP